MAPDGKVLKRNKAYLSEARGGPGAAAKLKIQTHAQMGKVVSPGDEKDDNGEE